MIEKYVFEVLRNEAKKLRDQLDILQASDQDEAKIKEVALKVASLNYATNILESAIMMHLAVSAQMYDSESDVSTLLESIKLED